MALNISLEELVLGYCRQVDGLVEPPAYGAYEVLLPDEVAARWGVAPHQHFAFALEAGDDFELIRDAKLDRMRPYRMLQQGIAARLAAGHARVSSSTGTLSEACVPIWTSGL